jgi:putative ABC transport system permease protein
VRRLSSLALRSLGARRLRAALTIVGVALGVAALFAVLATDVGFDVSAERTVDDIFGRSALRVSAFEERGLDPETVAAIVATPGAGVVAASLERPTFVSPTLGSGVARPLDPVTVLAIDPEPYVALHDLRLASGVVLGPDTQQSALISETLARDAGLSLGGQLTLLGAGEAGPGRFRVIGILAGEGPPVEGAFGRTVVVTLDAARRLFGTDAVTAVDVGLAPGASGDDVVAGLESRLTRQLYVIRTRAELLAATSAQTAEIRSTAALLAAVVLFVAAFLIFNTLSMTVAERTREVGLLRAAGATRRQVYGLVLAEAAAIGAAGSVLGLGLGVVFAGAIVLYVRRIEGFVLDALAVPPAGVVLALAVGFLVTIVAAIEPALRAARISPVEALRVGRDPAAGERARLRWLAIVLGVVAAVAVLLAPSDAPGSGAIRSLVVYGQLLVVALLTPFMLPALSRAAGLVVGPVMRAEERLARGSIARDRARAALAAGALAVGLAMVVALGTVAQNARLTGTGWIADVLPGTEVVRSIRPVGLDEGIGEQLAAVEGVERVTPFATFDVALRGTRQPAVATVGADLAADGRLSFVAGDRAAALADLDAGGTVILPRSTAERLDAGVGDELTVPTGAGPVALRVTAIVERTILGGAGESIFVAWSDATGSFGVLGADFFVVRFEAGREAAARPALEGLARGLALEPVTVEEVRAAIGDALGRLFGLFDALALVAVVVAGLGIVNTFAMSVIERVREIGILRATGMTRAQVRRMVVVEAAVLGAAGAILGCAAGVVIGIGMIVLGGGSRLGIPLEPAWGAIATAAGIGLLVPALAAAYPARIAARVPIVQALKFE